DADGAVRDVERWESRFCFVPANDVEIEEVDDVASAGDQPIDQIADDAAKDKSQGNLAAEGMWIKMMAGQHQDDGGNHGNAGEHSIVTGQHAPARAGVSPVHEPEEAMHD